jgi:hypothetical protein
VLIKFYEAQRVRPSQLEDQAEEKQVELPTAMEEAPCEAPGCLPAAFDPAWRHVIPSVAVGLNLLRLRADLNQISALNNLSFSVVTPEGTLGCILTSGIWQFRTPKI